MNKKMLLTLTTGCLLVTTMFTGCGQEREELSSAADNVTAVAGHIYLSVNPEIKISYNNDGLVTEILGVNEDGKGIVSVYDNYIGKDCSDVVSGLVEEIHAAGYFVEEVEGEHKQIVIELEAGSKLPDGDFLDEISEDVNKTVAGLALGSDVVIRDDGDSNYGDSNYDSNDDSTSDYGNTDYDSDDDSTSDYGNTDYDSDDDSTSDYGNTDYDSDDDGQSDYTPTPTNPPATQAPAVNGNSDYGNSDYSDSGYDAGSNYDDSGYDAGSNYGNSDYDD